MSAEAASFLLGKLLDDAVRIAAGIVLPPMRPADRLRPAHLKPLIVSLAVHGTISFDSYEVGR
jgi:hypothetical protein